MDEVLLQKVSRQLRLLNIWITFLSVLLIGSFIAFGITLFIIFSYVHREVNKVDSFQQQAKQSLDVKQQACDDSTIKSLLDSHSELCN